MIFIPFLPPVSNRTRKQLLISIKFWLLLAATCQDQAALLVPLAISHATSTIGFHENHLARHRLDQKRHIFCGFYNIFPVSSEVPCLLPASPGFLNFIVQLVSNGSHSISIASVSWKGNQGISSLLIEVRLKTCTLKFWFRPPFSSSACKKPGRC